MPAPSIPVGLPSPMPLAPAVANPSGLNWQPAGGASQPFMPSSSNSPPSAKLGVVPVTTVTFRAQAPQSPATLDELVKDAAKGWAIVELVKTTGPNKLSIYLVTSTEAAARAAAESISRLPQLRQYEVTFEARVK